MDNGWHRCQQVDDIESELAAARNVALFGKFRASLSPPFTRHRSRELLLMEAQLGRAALRQAHREQALANAIPVQRSTSPPAPPTPPAEPEPWWPVRRGIRVPPVGGHL